MNNFNFYNELEIENVLQCPVCFELPNSVIFLCKVGHHMCDKCRKKLTVCPTCQSALTGSRNFLAEALMARLAVFKGSGDGPNNNQPDSTITESNQQTQPQLELKDNVAKVPQLRCASGTFFCQLESCSTKVQLGVSNLVAHLQDKHSHFFEKFKNSTGTFSHNFDNFCCMKKKSKYTRAFEVTNFGLFFLNIILIESHLQIWLSTSASQKHANVFKYSLKFCTEETNVKLYHLNHPASTQRHKVSLLERGEILIIRPEQHKLVPGHFFSIQVKIVYKPEQ